MSRNNVRDRDCSSGLLPSELQDYPTRSRQWRPITAVLADGLGWPRMRSYDWWDYHMKLDLKSVKRDSGMTSRIHQVPSLESVPDFLHRVLGSNRTKSVDKSFLA